MTQTEDIRQARRNTFQKWIGDPLTALPAYVSWGIFRALPVRWASALGGFLGGCAGRILRRRNRIGLINLKIAFPEKSEVERKEILNKMWRHWGRFYAEMPHTTELFNGAEMKGLEHLKRLAKSGGFVCSAHLGNWELAVSQPLFQGLTLNPVYRRANNPLLDKLMFQRRAGILIPKGGSGARTIVRVLHQKGVVVMLCDQKLREGIEVPLFGHPAMTAPAIAVLALKMKMPIVMARSIRQPDGHFVMEVSAPLELPPKYGEAEVRQVMIEINRRLEAWIRENPEQWLWIHRRFDKSIYEPDSGKLSK